MNVRANLKGFTKKIANSKLVLFLLKRIYYFKSLVTNIVLKFKPLKKLEPIQLLPLYPELVSDDGHALYVRALNEALEDPEIQNIALTGSYGAGKSSILKDFASSKQKRIISISFSTLGGTIPNYANDIKKGFQAGADKNSNLIQKEIVKQILYREKYDKVPDSRYPKIHRVNIGKIILFSLILTILAVVIYQYSGISNTINVLTDHDQRVFTFLLVSLFIALIFLVAVILTVRNKMKVEKVSGGGVSIALKASSNYFDQYLDEIIYFFEVTKYDIVIFEDIDRFNNLYIFENLRQLNSLLNNSKQIGKHIRFVYAVKDSIFSQQTKSQPPDSDGDDDDNGGKKDNSNSNRTKFFDVMIPVVPFITHQNSRDVMTGRFARYELEKNVISLVSRHVTDMRMVKNIYNEYVIFHEMIIAKGKIKELSPSRLFAIIAYKNTYLKDFELLRLGESKIDKAFDAYKAFVGERILALETRRQQLLVDLESFDATLDSSVKYGRELAIHIMKMMENLNAHAISYTLNDASYTKIEELETENFWKNVSSSEDNVGLRIDYQVNSRSNPYAISGQFETISVASIKELIGNSLDLTVWRDKGRDVLVAEQMTIARELSELRKRSLQEVMSLYADFRDNVLKISGDGLLYDLLANGYIDKIYVLYTSIYREENVSANGRTYIVKAIEQNKQEVNFHFNDEQEIESTIAEIQDIDFQNRIIYNIDILNFLLKKDKPQLSHVLKNIAEATPDDISFLDEYIRNGKEVDHLMKKLANIWVNIFTYIAETKTLDRGARVRLLNIAMAASNSELTYQANDSIARIISSRSSEFRVLINKNPKNTITKVAKMLKYFNVIFKDLNGLNEAWIRVIGANGLFEVNRNNLVAIVGSRNISLSNILSRAPEILDYVIEHLDEYLWSTRNLKSFNYAIENSKDFIEIINKVSSINPDALVKVMRKSSSGSIVRSLDDIEIIAWPSIVNEIRMDNTLSNILFYYDEYGVDASLSTFLSFSAGIDNNIEQESDDEDDPLLDKKIELAVSIIDSSLIPVESRSRAVVDLGLTQYIDVTDFELQEGEIYGILIRDDVITDKAETYMYLIDQSWDVKESYIQYSKGFIEYIAEVTFKDGELEKLFASKVIPDALKTHIAQNIGSYQTQLSLDLKQAILEYASGRSVKLSSEVLALISNSSFLELSLKVISQNLFSLTVSDMINIMPTLGDNYDKLVQPGKHPTLPNNTYNIAIVKHAYKLGMVNTFRETSSKIKINMKSSW